MRVLARVQIGLGALVIGLGVLLAAAAWQLPPAAYPFFAVAPPPAGQESLLRVTTSLVLIVAGLVFGVPFILFGKLVLAFLDVRRRLVRIDARLRSRERSNDRESSVLERLRHRPGLR